MGLYNEELSEVAKKDCLLGVTEGRKREEDQKGESRKLHIAKSLLVGGENGNIIIDEKFSNCKVPKYKIRLGNR